MNIKVVLVKKISKILLATYLLILLWLVLFKFKVNFSVFSDNHTRNLNLIPFADLSRDNLRDVIYNFVGFIPFGLLLGVTLKRTSFWRRLAYILLFSLALEVIQFVLALGVMDITDVFTNALGGLLGLLLYNLSNKNVDTEKLDRSITITGVVLLIPSVIFLSIVINHGVRYQSAPRGKIRLERQSL